VTIPDRRTVLRSGLAAAALGAVGAATGCTSRPAPTAASPARRHLIGPRSPQVAAAEAARHATGTVQAGVAPEAGHVDLGGPVVPTWSFGGQVPGPEIRVRAGQKLQALLVNRLPVETTVHWHGVALGGHQMTVTHTDGYPVAPVRAGALLIGMGERYDVQAPDRVAVRRSSRIVILTIRLRTPRAPSPRAPTRKNHHIPCGNEHTGQPGLLSLLGGSEEPWLRTHTTPFPR
jgi:FtsP/CotA-like multicopper oxidase with cupredoxin domain